MSPNVSGAIVVRRTHDPDEIYKILRADAFDAPIPYFTNGVLRTAVRAVLAPSRDVYFAVAELDGRYVGFSLGHTLGPTFWRAFAREHLWHHPVALPLLILRLKVLKPMRWAIVRAWSQRAGSQPATSTPMGTVPRIERPFSWSRPRPDIGQIDQLFVSEQCRGAGVATRLVKFVSEEMCHQQVSLVEAHVDLWNDASLRAFLKAGWTGVQTSGGDYYVSFRPGSVSASS